MFGFEVKKPMEKKRQKASKITQNAAHWNEEGEKNRESFPETIFPVILPPPVPMLMATETAGIGSFLDDIDNHV